MFGKPKALITVQRQTGVEEHTTVVVNASKCTKKAIYEAIVQAGDALILRLISNNEFAKKALEDTKAFDPTSKKNKKGNK